MLHQLSLRRSDALEQDRDDGGKIAVLTKKGYGRNPVFRVAVKAVSPNDLPKLIEGLRKLVKADPLVLWTSEETGENIIAGCGELHMEICIHELRKYAGKEIIVSEPIVSYRETVLEASEEAQLVKTNNKKNRFWGGVAALPEDLVSMI